MKESGRNFISWVDYEPPADMVILKIKDRTEIKEWNELKEVLLDIPLFALTNTNGAIQVDPETGLALRISKGDFLVSKKMAIGMLIGLEEYEEAKWLEENFLGFDSIPLKPEEVDILGKFQTGLV